MAFFPQRCRQDVAVEPWPPRGPVGGPIILVGGIRHNGQMALVAPEHVGYAQAE